MTDYGRDVYCLDSLRTGRWATGVRVVAQRCYHRLITRRGQLRGGEDEADFGYDVAGLVGHTNKSIAAIQGEIRNELRKDPQVLDAAVTVTRTVAANGSAAYAIEVDCTTDAGPFSLVLAVSDVTVQLVGLEAA